MMNCVVRDLKHWQHQMCVDSPAKLLWGWPPKTHHMWTW